MNSEYYFVVFKCNLLDSMTRLVPLPKKILYPVFTQPLDMHQKLLHFSDAYVPLKSD